MDPKKRILIVDDESDLVEVFRMRLEREGYEILTAYDGQEGLQKARTGNPDLILLDIMMPKINGYQVCLALKTDRRFAHIPIIFISANLDNTEIVGYSIGESKADDRMQKPIDQNYLINRIRELLSPSKLMDASAHSHSGHSESAESSEGE